MDSTAAPGSAPDPEVFLDRVVDLDHSRYERLTAMTDYRRDPGEARILYLCRRLVAGGSSMTETGSEETFVMKIKIQYAKDHARRQISRNHVSDIYRVPPRPASDDPREPLPGPSVTTVAEIAALRKFQREDLAGVPHLVATKCSRQGSNGPFPGGYVSYIVMTVMPGRDLMASMFWSLDDVVKEEIRDAFVILLKREKLSHDPNNTAWTRATDNYGHRILASQGWKTGDYLGAENAPHADHYTAANASHVRVLLREDNLGLGAKVGGKANAETFGLSTLSSIFGRLNGKSEGDVEKLERGLRDAELRSYQAEKHGYMNFVRGGLLVGDKIEEVQDTKVVVKTVDVEVGKASKKRKAGKDAPEVETEDGSKERRKKQKSAARDEAPVNLEGVAKETAILIAETASASDPVALGDDDREKAAKRQRKAQRRAERETREPGTDISKDDKARLKLEKRARKEERRKRKEEKRALKAAEPSSDSDSTTTAVTTAILTPISSGLTSGVSTPIQATPAFAGGRHAIRQRYIMQKRMASMDPRALNEILMIKAQV
ncbi:telomerase inhibitor [Friedmanniomyces endolithicus]|uniref:PinX1-related protein 1 n=1 Tax=Friedmanniomyces endolithicus TaxID=329885 RepID=A0AAN6J7Y1_9PEZI|nr:telomerase inhibitor [Friedmanniomyces endolithicus]